MKLTIQILCLSLAMLTARAHAGNEGAHGGGAVEHQAKPLMKARKVFKAFDEIERKILSSGLPKPFVYAIVDEIKTLRADAKNKLFSIDSKIMVIGKDYLDDEDERDEDGNKKSPAKLIVVDAFTDNERYAPIYLAKTAYRNNLHLQFVLMHELTHHVLPSQRPKGRHEEANEDERLIDDIAKRVVNNQSLPYVDQLLRDLFVLNESTVLDQMAYVYLLIEEKKVPMSQIREKKVFSSDSAASVYYRILREEAEAQGHRYDHEQAIRDVEEFKRSHREEILSMQAIPLVASIARGLDLGSWSYDSDEGWMPFDREKSLWNSPSTYQFGRWDSYGDSIASEIEDKLKARQSYSVVDLERDLARGLPENGKITWVAASQQRWDLIEHLAKLPDYDPNYAMQMFSLSNCGRGFRFTSFEAQPETLAHVLIECGFEKGALALIAHPRFQKNIQDAGHSLMSRAIRGDRRDVFDLLRSDKAVRAHLFARKPHHHGVLVLNSALSSAWVQPKEEYMNELLRDFENGNVPAELENEKGRAMYLLGSFLAAVQRLKLDYFMKRNGVQPPWTAVDAKTLIDRAYDWLIPAIDAICKDGGVGAEGLLKDSYYAVGIGDLAGFGGLSIEEWFTSPDSPERRLSTHLRKSCEKAIVENKY